MSSATQQAVSYVELDDSELVRRCLSKDEQAWSTLLKRYAGLIYSIPLKQGLGRDMAEEVFQSVAMTLVERLHVLLDPECLPKWLMVTTARRCRLLQQRQRRQLEPPETSASPVSEDAQQSLERAELKLHLDYALEQLGDRDRAVLLDLFDKELPYVEVARRHGLAVGSLGSLRARALTRLRKILEKRGIA